MNGMKRLAWVVLVLGPAGSVGAQAPEAADVAGAEEGAEELQTKLLAAALKDGPTDEVTALFMTYACVRAKERAQNAVDKEFWTWLERNREVREGLLIGLVPKYDEGVLRGLERLRKTFGNDAEAHPQLTLAFAFVWGPLTSERDITKPVGGFYRARVPASMEESFRYYLDNEKAMRVDLKTTPWPLLAYVADNDLPIDERRWALEKYGGWTNAKWRGLWTEVHYEVGSDEKEWQIGERPRTLENLYKYGGAMRERSYFASRVLKSLGVPAAIDEPTQQQRQARVAWVHPARKIGSVKYEPRPGRRDLFHSGVIYSPLEQTGVPDYELDMLCAAVGGSFDAFKKAAVGCHVCDLLGDAERKNAKPLLLKCVACSPCCEGVWQRLCTICASGEVPDEEGDDVYALALDKLADYPDCTCGMLGELIVVRREKTPAASKGRALACLKLFTEAEKRYEEARRPDLVARANYFRGRYLETIDRKDQALKLYLKAARDCAAEPYGFFDAYERAIELMPGDENRDRRIEFLRDMAKQVPVWLRAPYGGRSFLNSTWTHVVRMLIAELRQAGKDREADRWEQDLKDKQEVR